MNHPKKNTTDFRQILGIPPGRDLAAFPSKLRTVLNFKEMAPEKSELDILKEAYHRLVPIENGSFRWLVEEYAQFYKIDEKSISEQVYQRDSEICILLFMDTRINGSSEVPLDWTPDSFVFTMKSDQSIGDPRHWRIFVCEGISFYTGQDNHLYNALKEYAKHLFSIPDAVNEAAMYLWDEISMCFHSGDFGGVIDGLKLAQGLPVGHDRVCRILDDNQLLTSNRPGVRLAATELLEIHNISKYVEGLEGQLTGEDLALIAEAQIRVLRAIGGEKVFNAFLHAAQNSKNKRVRHLATRALAWVNNFPENSKYLFRLCRSKEYDLSSIGTAAMAERKHHSVFHYGGRLATMQETLIAETFKRLMDERSDEEDLRLLRDAFENKQLIIKTGDEAESAGVDRGGAIVCTKDGIVVLMLHRKHLELGQHALEKVYPGDLRMLRD